MTPLSTSVESLSSFVEQFGVVDSGDALAVLRCLSLNINEAMGQAVGTRQGPLEEQMRWLKRLEDSRVADRLSAGQRVEGFVGWSPVEAQALKLLVEELHLPAGLGPFEPLVRYQRQVTMPDGTVLTEESATTASRFKDWLTDYERTVNDLGQVVWTRVADLDGGLRLTIVFTELENLQGVPASQVEQLKTQVEEERLANVTNLAASVNTLRFTLEEWWSDVRIDDRWYRFARSNEDRRTERQADDRRNELALDSLRQDISVLRSRLQALGHEWPTLAQALAALQTLQDDRPGTSVKVDEVLADSPMETGPEPALDPVHERAKRRLGDTHG